MDDDKLFGEVFKISKKIDEEFDSGKLSQENYRKLRDLLHKKVRTRILELTLTSFFRDLH